MSDFLYDHRSIFGISVYDIDNMQKYFGREDHEYIPQTRRKFGEDMKPERRDWIEEKNAERLEYGFYLLRPSGL